MTSRAEILKEQQLEKSREQLRKAVSRLGISQAKAALLPTDPASLTDDQLEIWDSYSSRLARVIDLFVSKFLRLSVLIEEPGFRGSTRDYLNQGEKLGLLSNAAHWMRLKELRNRQAHDYEDEDLRGLFEAIRAETDFLVQECSQVLQKR